MTIAETEQLRPQIEPAGKLAKRPAPAQRSRSAKEPAAKPILAADCVRVAQALTEAMTMRRDEVLQDPSPANVHAFRGALRRAAGALKLFKPEAGDADEAWSRAELKWLARQYGDVRDLDVLIGRFEAAAQPWTNAAREDEMVLGAALKAREVACATALASTTTVRALGIVDGLAAWAKLWRPITGATMHDAHIAALAAADAKIRNYGADIGDFSSHARHRLRARIKILRYECEAMTQLTAVSVSGYDLKLTLLHQLLGDLHDAEVGAKLAARLSKPAAVTVAEKKIATERRRALKAAWSDFRAAESPWPPGVQLAPA